MIIPTIVALYELLKDSLRLNVVICQQYQAMIPQITHFIDNLALVHILGGNNCFYSLFPYLL